MNTYVRPALSLALVMTLVTGALYPLAVTGIAQVAFPEQANGSLVRDAGGRVVGPAYRVGGDKPWLREIVILRVGVITGSAYEVYQHRRIAQAYRIADERIDAVIAGDMAALTPLEQAVCAMVETVLALGNPFGLGGSVSRGILSSKSRRPVEPFARAITLRALSPSRCEYSSCRNSPGSEISTFESEPMP